MAGAERIEWARGWEREIAAQSLGPLREAGTIVLTAMRSNLPASQDGSYGRPAGYARSRLRFLAQAADAQGPYLDVGTDATTPQGDSYPAMLEHGTKAHDIVSHGRWPLRDRHGRVFGHAVRHPGTKPIPWARNSAAAVNGRNL